jgi:anti-anti-sigma factor
MTALEGSSDSLPDFDVYIDHRTRCVEVVGDLDIATVSLLVDAATSLRTEPPRDMTIDLDSVTFIGATGFGALVGLCNSQHDQGVRLHLIANDQVKWVARLCALEALLID